MTATRRLLGLDFACASLDEAARLIASRPPNAPFGYVVTPNADHLVRMSRVPALRSLYRSSLLCLLDSRVVAMLSGLLGLAPPPVVTGSDLTCHLLSHHVLPGERIAIIGLSPVWLPALMARFDLAPPAHFDPPVGFDQDPEAMARVVDFVRSHPARLVFLAVGSPRQERLAAALAQAGGIVGTGFCIGASLEFLCGARRRAPRVMQQLGLEWLWRLGQEPARLGPRYLRDSPKIIGLLLRARLARSSRGLRA